MKKFAILLPQFHEIPENNEWWGKGFTEWISVKKSRPLFRGHLQPQLPYNNYYYNLLDKSTMEWQTKLLHKYGIDGFAYYHYYFNGKLMMEKPAENLLTWKDIDQPFFFYWANHSFYHSWEGKNKLLLEQTYGSKEDWERHFQYLLPFFRDRRYEKKDNMPVFALYADFPEKEDVFSYFNQRCIEEGFDGIYLIETYYGGNYFPKDFQHTIDNVSTVTKAIYLRQPNSIKVYKWNGFNGRIRHAVDFMKSKMADKFKTGELIPIQDGNRLYERLMKIEFPQTSLKIIPGVFFGWDNTPRYGYRGDVITPIDKAHFTKYMDSVRDSDYILLNAWNEWAEGMMLEPTQINRYKYLEWIKEWSESNTDDREDNSNCMGIKS
jgi:hypothetical protein